MTVAIVARKAVAAANRVDDVKSDNGANRCHVGRHPLNAAKLLLIASLFLCAGNAFAQSVEKEPAAVVEMGAAINRSLTESQSSFGPTVAVEVTPIENWLELEAGATPLFRRHSTEWSIDLLFKKPWTLSDRMEFMIRIGPEWIHTNAYGVAGELLFRPVPTDNAIRCVFL